MEINTNYSEIHKRQSFQGRRLTYAQTERIKVYVDKFAEENKFRGGFDKKLVDGVMYLYYGTMAMLHTVGSGLSSLFVVAAETSQHKNVINKSENLFAKLAEKGIKSKEEKLYAIKYLLKNYGSSVISKVQAGLNTAEVKKTVTDTKKINI